jgi:hypothetical protein
LRRAATILGAGALTLALSPVAAGQAVLKVDETVSFRFGFSFQGWADWAQDAASGGYAQNLFIRRASLYAGARLARSLTFFFRSDSANLGKAPKGSFSTFFIEDAYLEWRAADAFLLDGGLILVPFCRNCLEYSVRLLTLDFGSFSFLSNSVTQSSVARDTGFQAKGYLAGDHLEYRVGVFQGLRVPGARNSFRSAGRLQYNFFETEKAQFYPGTYLGAKKILAIGAGYDLQGDYRAWAADLFVDLPLGHGNGLTGEFDFIRWDGGSTFPTLLRQNDVLLQGGYYISALKLSPWARWESQRYADAGSSSRGQQKFQFGLTWYPAAFNFNIRAAWGRVLPRADGLRATNQFTVQLQVFYF